MSDSSLPAAERRVAVLLLAGGVGQRTGFAKQKQLTLLGDKPVLAWSLDAFADHAAISHGVIVASVDTQTSLPHLPDGWQIVPAGNERRQSVAHGLAALADWPDDAAILVHDAARPGVTSSVIDDLLAAIESGAAGATPVLPVPDTLVAVAEGKIGGVMDRTNLARVQTPQAFRLGALRQAHAQWDGSVSATDDAQMVRALGLDVVAIRGDPRLHKLTYPEDLAILQALLVETKEASMRTATGLGYDVHRLVADKPLWIGGIEIPHSHGLSGHSDADVALHALTDAILGALADGDIGDHFPPSDPQWRGAESHLFVRFAADRVKACGGSIAHVDVTIIAEAPRIGPYRAAIRSRIAEILALSQGRVSVKATTTEGLGFAGRREGIAAQAIATLTLPED